MPEFLGNETVHRIDMRKWTSEEDIFLKNNLKLSDKELAKQLNRSISSIGNRRYVLNLKRFIHYRLTEDKKKITPQLCYIMGVLFGDGCLHKKWDNGFREIILRVKDFDFIQYFNKNVFEWSGKQPKIYEYTRVHNHTTKYGNKFNCVSHCYVSSTSSVEIANFLGELKENFLELIKIQNNECKANFIKGFYDSEGSVQIPSRQILSFNSNKKVLEVIRDLLFSLGIKISGFYYRERYNYYIMTIGKNESTKKFYELIGFSIMRKEEKLKEILKLKIDFRPYELYESAFRLRNDGLLIREVSKQLNIPVGTISRWTAPNFIGFKPNGFLYSRKSSIGGL